MSACPLGCPFVTHPESPAWEICEACGIEKARETHGNGALAASGVDER